MGEKSSAQAPERTNSRRGTEALLEGRYTLRDSEGSEPRASTSGSSSPATSFPKHTSRWTRRLLAAGAAGNSKSEATQSSPPDEDAIAPCPAPLPKSRSSRGSASTCSRNSDTSSFMGSPRVTGSPKVTGSPRVLRRGTSLLGELVPKPASVLFRSLQLESRLGEGRYGMVWKCVDPKIGMEYACKQVDKTRNPKSLKREVECLTRVQVHPGVLRLEGVYESELYLYLVTELCDGGDLFEYLSKTGPLRESQARGMFGQLARALNHCHARGVMHRDIKPENVLLKQCGAEGELVAKLADFGLSKRMMPGEMTVGWVGSDPYEAPEVLALKPYDFSADVFSLGVVLFGMLSGTWPSFKEGRVFDAEAEFAWPGWKRISKEARDLLASMLSHQPSARPKMSEVVNHAWLKSTAPDIGVAKLTKAQSARARVQQGTPQDAEKGEIVPLHPQALRIARAKSHSDTSGSEGSGNGCSNNVTPRSSAAAGVVASRCTGSSLSEVSWAGSELSSPQSCLDEARTSFELSRDTMIK